MSFLDSGMIDLLPLLFLLVVCGVAVVRRLVGAPDARGCPVPHPNSCLCELCREEYTKRVNDSLAEQYAAQLRQEFEQEVRCLLQAEWESRYGKPEPVCVSKSSVSFSDWERQYVKTVPR